MFSLLCIKFGFNVQEATQISGERNWRCDTLSRLTQEKFTISEALKRIDRSSTKIVDISNIESTTFMLRNCDPLVSIDDEDDFFHFLTEVQSALNAIETTLTMLLLK